MMGIFSTLRLKSFANTITPSGIQDTVSRTWNEVGDKVDAFYRGVSAYAYKAPENTRDEGLKFLASRAKFINPTFQQFLKTVLFYGIPAGLSLRATIPVTLGSYLPIAVVATAVVAIMTLGTALGFIRQKFAGNDLEKALRFIVSQGHPGMTLENLPEAIFVNKRIEMGQNPVAVVKNPKTRLPEYVAFRYIEKGEAVDKIHTRIYSISGKWINTGTTVESNHIYDISTSLEGRYVADLIKAARGEPLRGIAIPPPEGGAWLKSVAKGIVRAATPDVARQITTDLSKEIGDRLDAYYLGRSSYTISENEKNPDLKFLATRDKFINPTIKELFLSVVLFGAPAYYCVRSFAATTLGPYMPITASLTMMIGLFALKYLAGVLRQFLAGNDLEKAMVAIVRASSPAPQAVERGKTVLDYLPNDTGAEALCVERKGTKVKRVIFRYTDGLPGRESQYTRIYNLGSGFSRSRTTHILGKVTQTTSCLESKYIEKLLKTAREYHTARVRAERAGAS